MKTKISLISILFLFFSIINVYSQDDSNKKASILFGLSIDRFSTQAPDLYGAISGSRWGFINSAEIHIPTKFSENIKLVIGGQYLYNVESYWGSYVSVNMSGGGIFAGINGEKYFTNGDFNFGLFTQTAISYQSFLSKIFNDQTDDFESITYSGAGGQFKIGMIVKYKVVSFKPNVNYNTLFINKESTLSMKGLGFGADIGFDF